MRQVVMQQHHTMPTGIFFFVWVSQRSVVSELSGPSLNRSGGGGGLGQGNSFFFWPIVLPQFENTAQLFYPRFCTQRNRKRLHHRLHPSSPAKRPVTFIDFWLSLLSTSNMTYSHDYSLRHDHCHQMCHLQEQTSSSAPLFHSFFLIFSAFIYS